MRGLVLKDDEVRELMRDGVVVVRREFILQPSEDWRPYSYGEVHRMRDGNFVMRNGEPVVVGYGASNADGDEAYICPIGQPGERRFVKEAFSIETAVEGRDQPLPHTDGRPVKYAPDDDYDGAHPGWAIAHYRATDPAPDLCCDRDNCAQCRNHDFGPHWRPSIHMPQWASRTTTECTHATAEQVDGVWRWAATHKRVEA